MESSGDESGDAAEVERQLLSLLKSKAQLKASRDFCMAFEAWIAQSACGLVVQGSDKHRWRRVLVGLANLPDVDVATCGLQQPATVAQDKRYAKPARRNAYTTHRWRTAHFPAGGG